MPSPYSVCYIFPYAPIYVTQLHVTPPLTRVSNPVLQNKILLPYHLNRDKERTVHNKKIFKKKLFSPPTPHNQLTRYILKIVTLAIPCALFLSSATPSFYMDRRALRRQCSHNHSHRIRTPATLVLSTVLVTNRVCCNSSFTDLHTCIIS